MATVVDQLITRLSIENLSVYQRDLDRSSASVAKWTAIAATGGAVATFAGKQIVDAYKAAAEETARFETSSNNFKGSLPVDELETLATQLSRLTAVEDGAIAGTIGLLGTYQMLGSQAKQIILPILNATRALEASGKSSEGLAEAVGKAFQGGNVTALRRYGIFVDEAAFKSDRLRALIDALQQQGGNAALEFGKSAAGGMLRFQNSVGDLQEAIGGKFLPAITPAIDAATKLVEGIADNGTAATVTAAILGGAVVVGTVAATTATWRLYSAVVALGNAYTATGAKAAAASTKAGGKGGGLAGLGVALAGDLGGQALADQGAKHGGVGGAFEILGGRTAQGAATGFAFGGARGAAIGGVVGALVGSVENVLRGSGIIKNAAEASKAEDPQLTELKKQTALLEKATGGGQAVDFNRLSIAQQRAIVNYGYVIA